MLRQVKGDPRFRIYSVDCKSEITDLSIRNRRINRRIGKFFKKLNTPFNIEISKFVKATDQGITVLKARNSWANLKLKR